MWVRTSKTILVLLSLGLVTSCDPDRKKKCEWYLVPELRHKDTVEAGWVSLCAKNYTTMKQKCFIQAKLDYAEKVFGKKFKYSDMKLDDKGFPKKVKSIEFCESE